MDKNLFRYAPGISGIGSKGDNGNQGEQGISFYFSTYDGLQNISTISTLISDNKELNDSDTELPDERIYLTGDVFLDVNGRIFEIDLSTGNKYKDTGMFLNSSTIFQAGPTQPEAPNFTRYTNLFNTDKILVDSVYANNVGNYTEHPDNIYSNKAIQYGKISYVDDDVISDLNGLYLYNVWTTGNNNDDAIALIREGNNNTWHFGNKDATTGTQRSVNLDLDFENVNISNDLNVNNNLNITNNTNTNTLTVNTNGIVQNNFYFNKSVTIGLPTNNNDTLHSNNPIIIDKQWNQNKVNQTSPLGTVLTNAEINVKRLMEDYFNSAPSSFDVSKPTSTSITVDFKITDFFPGSTLTQIQNEHYKITLNFVPQYTSSMGTISYTDDEYKPVSIVIPLSLDTQSITINNLTASVDYSVYLEFATNAGWKRRSGEKIIFSVSPTSLDFSTFGGNGNINITTGESWTATNPNWLSISPDQGTSSATMQATAPKNVNLSANSGTIDITSGGDTKHVSVSQPAAKFEIDKSTINLQTTADSDTAILTTTLAWNIDNYSTKPSWISASPNSDSTVNSEEDTVITFSAEANNTGSSRDHTFTFRSTENTGVYLTVTVNQGGQIEIEFNSHNRLDYKYNSTTGQTNSVTANVPWIISNLPNWISANPDSGNAGTNISVTFTPKSTASNTGTDYRDGTIIIYDQNTNTQQDTFTVRQYPDFNHTNPSNIPYISYSSQSKTYDVSINYTVSLDSVTGISAESIQAPTTEGIFQKRTLSVTFEENTGQDYRDIDLTGTANLLPSGSGSGSYSISFRQYPDFHYTNPTINSTIPYSATPNQTYSVTTNYSVAFTANQTGIDGTPTLSATTEGESNTETLTVSFTKNSNSDKRNITLNGTATLLPSGTGTKSYSIDFVQDACTVFYTATQSVNLDGHNGSDSFSLSSNIPWTASWSSTDGNWLTYTSSGTNPNNTLDTYTISLNTNSDNISTSTRTGTLKLTGTDPQSGTHVIDINITQDVSAIISVSKTLIKSWYGDSLTQNVDISSNVSWTSSSYDDDNLISSYSPTSGNAGTETVQIIMNNNTSTNEISASIYFDATNGPTKTTSLIRYEKPFIAVTPFNINGCPASNSTKTVAGTVKLGGPHYIWRTTSSNNYPTMYSDPAQGNAGDTSVTVYINNNSYSPCGDQNSSTQDLYFIACPSDGQSGWYTDVSAHIHFQA